MSIEQRIGRIHRIGQTREVFIFNLCVRGTIEEHVLDILDGKINLFELVVGELDAILGHLGADRDFEQVVLDLWLEADSDETAGEAFRKLGEQASEARAAYDDVKKLDEKLFSEDFEA